MIVIPLLSAIVLTIVQKNYDKRKIEKNASTDGKTEAVIEKKLQYKNMSIKNKILHIVMFLVAIVIVVSIIVNYITITNISRIQIPLLSIFMILQANKYQQKNNRRDIEFWMPIIAGIIFFVLAFFTIYIEFWILIITGIIFFAVAFFTICI